MSKRKSGIAGKIIALAFFTIILAFFVLLRRTELIPDQYLALGGVAFMISFLLAGFLLWDAGKKGRFVAGIVLSVALTVFLVVAVSCLHRAVTMLERITVNAAHMTTEPKKLGIQNGETTAQEPVQEPVKESSASDDVLCVYISGIDTRGEMTDNSRSDVNIIVTINTGTRQALLLSTPRDYFVPLSISGGVPDKLTHAGIYGVDVSMDTLSMLYDIELDYYFRLNFGGFIQIIDALGGITLVSDYEFDSHGFHFEEGENHVDGEQALAFARERYSFEEGDRQRGRNQMAVIKGVADKMLSTELLKNYSAVMEGIEGSFETNIPYKILAGLVKQQLLSGGTWNIVSYSVDGTGDTRQPYSMSTAAYVMIPDESTVEKAKELMRQVREGETLSQE